MDHLPSGDRCGGYSDNNSYYCRSCDQHEQMILSLIKFLSRQMFVYIFLYNQNLLMDKINFSA